MWLGVACVLGFLSVVFSAASLRRSGRVGDGALRSLRPRIGLPELARRADYTARGWMWRKLSIAFQVGAVVAMLTAFFTG